MVEFGVFLKVESIGFADGLDVECDKQSVIVHVFVLSTWIVVLCPEMWKTGEDS